MAQVCTTYAGVPQRWVVIESASRLSSDLNQWHQTLAIAQRTAQTQLKRLCSVSFACEADARQAG
ncbi:MAG: hypothetical protein F6K30_14885 [Cyanothece sp. SIO2G6]|nr:hypothetical protein [Cyanothece sp. SIO2G6]